MVKFYKKPTQVKYDGELEKVSFEFLVPVEKNPRSGLTGFEVLDRMVRPVQKGISQKVMSFVGFKYLGVKRTKVRKKKIKDKQ